MRTCFVYVWLGYFIQWVQIYCTHSSQSAKLTLRPRINILDATYFVSMPSLWSLHNLTCWAISVPLWLFTHTKQRWLSSTSINHNQYVERANVFVFYMLLLIVSQLFFLIILISNERSQQSVKSKRRYDNNTCVPEVIHFIWSKF